MNVELRPQKLTHVLTKQPVDPVQYEIWLDGSMVGFLPFHEGASPLLIKKLGPIETREMMLVLRGKLNPHKIGQAVHPPDPPKETEPDDGEYLDPFAAIGSDETEV